MGVFQDWQNFIENMTEDQVDYFQAEYYDKETEAYRDILINKDAPIEGRFDELCEKYGFEPRMFAGFLEGINASLKKEMELEKLRVNTKVTLDVDFKKLYFHMLEAKANWLYELPEWEDILTPEERQDIVKERNQSKQAVSEKIDRNAPCPCGSGKKYKKCCGKIA
ncbi:SEC-C domain-containing protein [Eubacteriales bacterium OttesenSCG-928-M02]|nr:SEC-C domain-containing protein [Eubacteriales bacterium OttesenSCG-928-M02]